MGPRLPKMASKHGTHAHRRGRKIIVEGREFRWTISQRGWFHGHREYPVCNVYDDRGKRHPTDMARPMYTPAMIAAWIKTNLLNRPTRESYILIDRNNKARNGQHHFAAQRSYPPAYEAEE